MAWWHYVWMLLIGFGAGFVQRVSGFGLGIFAMLFLPHLMPTPAAAASVVVLSSTVTCVANALRYRKKVAYATVLPLILATLVVLPFAVSFSAQVSARIFKILLGVVLILLSLYFLVFSGRLRIKPCFSNGLLAGTLSGVLNGLFSTGGPPAVLYLTNATASADVYFASVQFYFACSNVYSVGVRLLNGFYTVPVLLATAATVSGCLSGDFCGRFVFEKLDGNKLKTIIYVAMILSGVVLLFG